MLKSILGIVVGYLVMCLFAVAGYFVAYLVLGPERIFEAGTYALSGIWLGLMVVFTLIAGLIGGLMCAGISKNRTTGLVFAVIVLVASFVFALPNIMKEHPPVARSGDVASLQAMQMAQPPGWLCILNPILAGVAVLIGTRMPKNSPAV
jgi:hypothetical protein